MARARLARVPATVIVGAQWGDEGKGKIVDLLAQDSDLVCRYQGGPNAGHTVVVRDETYKIRQIPTGLIGGKRCAIGAGCVVDPEVLVSELDELESRGHQTRDLLFVSGNAHLIMPWHVALDGARERRLGRLQIGTTRRGIGPAYADKATRIGIRVQDLLDPKILRQKLELAVTEKNVWLERVYGLEPFDVEVVVRAQLEFAERLGHTSPTRHCSWIAPCVAASTCSSRGRRGPCSTSTTARIPSSPRPARSRPARP
jgi:adenylosuccinate synthase